MDQKWDKSLDSKKSNITSLTLFCNFFYIFFFLFQGNLDYHQDMDGTNFNAWAEEAFKELPPNSVIVMVSKVGNFLPQIKVDAIHILLQRNVTIDALWISGAQCKNLKVTMWKF